MATHVSQKAPEYAMGQRHLFGIRQRPLFWHGCEHTAARVVERKNRENVKRTVAVFHVKVTDIEARTWGGGGGGGLFMITTVSILVTYQLHHGSAIHMHIVKGGGGGGGEVPLKT